MQKKEFIQLGITGVLVIVLIFAIVRAIDKGRKSGEKRPKKARVLVDVSQANTLNGPHKGEYSAAGIFKKLEEEGKRTNFVRDPFSGAPIITEEDSSSGVLLNGILWDEKNPMAIINDEVVKTGDHAAGYAVIEIKEDKVLLRNDAGDLELSLE